MIGVKLNFMKSRIEKMAVISSTTGYRIEISD